MHTVIYMYLRTNPPPNCEQAFNQTLKTGRPGDMFSHKIIRD